MLVKKGSRLLSVRYTVTVVPASTPDLHYAEYILSLWITKVQCVQSAITESLKRLVGVHLNAHRCGRSCIQLMTSLYLL